MMNLLKEFKHLTALTLLILGGMFSASSYAQCGDDSNPAVSIEHICLSPGNTGNIEVYGNGFDNILSFKIAVCYSTNPAFTVIGATPAQNVTSSWDQNNDQFTFEFNAQGTCAMPGPTSFNPNAPMATIEVAATQTPGTSGTMFMTMCPLTTNVPSEFTYCDGNQEVTATPNDCVGGASLADTHIDITGEIRDIHGNEMPNVPISHSETLISTLTGPNGGYTFNNILVNGVTTLSVFPTPGGINININGITTFDVVPIKAHLEGPGTGTALTCLQMIAADADGDGVVTNNDADLIDKTAKEQQVYGNVGSWVFVPEDFDLDCNYPNNFNSPVPSGFPTSVTFNGFCDDYYTGDFIAVHIGDLVDDPNPVDKHSNAFSATDDSRMVQLVENPFRESAVMDFNFPTDAPATVRVFDQQGKLLHVSKHALANGKAQVRLDTHTWPAGMLMFQVQAGNERYAGRLLHLQ